MGPEIREMRMVGFNLGTLAKLDVSSRFSLGHAAVLFAVMGSIFTVSGPLRAQGVLTVTPSSTISTIAGTATPGSAGAGGADASPSGVAYDGNGNLYFADARNHVVREVAISGQITTLAGTGVEGYGGDNGPATAALLDTPTGVAVDAKGNLYIADSHNHRLRKVSSGTITTIAGTGTPGYSGDRGSATAAQLSLPSAVAVDVGGNVYIADTNNHRIRKITGTTISTIAGDGEELYAGDGAAATAAALDLPSGVAVDANGNVYIADRNNQRVRMIAPTGTISTLAGSGNPGFSGSFSGDGASANAARLAKPRGVNIDQAGNVYVADTGNQRIRQVSGATITTVAGNGQQGFGGDSDAATNAILNSPRAASADSLGNLTIADTLNGRLRMADLPKLTFASEGVGVPSTPQSVTLANTGSASITVASIVLTGSFTAANGGSCSAIPITLAPNASCTQNLAFLPATSGIANGSVVFGGVGVVPQSILLAGTGVQTATTVTLTSDSNASVFAGQNITFTATVKPAGMGTPTGSVSFYDGSTVIGGSVLAAGSVSVTSALVAGTHSITAVYAGDANFVGNTSAALSQLVLDSTFTIATTTPSSQTVTPGQPASFTFNLLTTGTPFPLPITLSATGLPPGATATFTPQVLAVGNSTINFTMTILTTAGQASVSPGSLFGAEYGDGVFALSLLLLPLFGRVQKRTVRLRLLMLCAATAVSLAGVGALAGCGTSRGHPSQPSQSYTIHVFGTVAGQSGAAPQPLTTVTLTVQDR